LFHDGEHVVDDGSSPNFWGEQKHLAKSSLSTDNATDPHPLKETLMSIASAMAVWQDRALNPFAGFLGSGFFVFALAVGVLVFIGCWKVFTKAGQPGWAALIPIYNAYILLKIAGRPGWWLLLFLVPVVNIAIGIIVAVDVAKAFGQSAMFGFFLLFLFGGIGYLILGFGNYSYRGVRTMAATA
jgi:Family of unknown function (DUF5684)